MSLLLDQHLVGEAAEHCPSEFLKYYQCLGLGDAQACLEEQKKLATCVKTKAPSFMKIVANCSDQMKAYEDCIRQNSDFRTKCFDKLKDMRSCVSQTMNLGPEPENSNE